MKTAIRCGATLSLLATLSLGHAEILANVGLYAQVEMAGGDFGYSGGWGEGTLADASIVTDGILLDSGHQWNMGTVYWSGLAGADRVNIYLPKAAYVSSLLLQTDNNDSYMVRYRGVDGVWHDLVNVYAEGVWGMNTSTVSLDTPVYATAFSVMGGGGDGKYSISEVQMLGSFDPAPVPEPSSLAMLAAGMVLLALPLRRRGVRARRAISGPAD